MLATSRSGERSRRWLQEHIWGSRDRSHAQASLRRELSNLRSILGNGKESLLISSHDTVSLDLSQVIIDVRNPELLEQLADEFLEGIDIEGEESFEEWLREERQCIAAKREAIAKTSLVPFGE
jgi:DNA-binding SARP family transcriptional activator